MGWMRVSGAAIALSLWGACLPASNAYDPAGDPEGLEPVLVTGELAFEEEGEVLDGVVVDIYRTASLEDGSEQERIVDTFGASEGRAKFSFEVPPDVTRVVVAPKRCGYEPVEIALPDSFPEQDANLPPGAEHDLGVITLEKEAASRTVVGRVERLDGASTDGIKVTLRKWQPGSEDCGATLGEAVTNVDGEYSVEGVDEGSFVAVAITEGATVAVSDVLDTCEAEEGAAVEVPLLSIRSSSGVLALSPVEPDPSLPPGVTREPRVNVTLGGFFDWASTMRLSEGPAFSDTDGWVPVQSPRLFPAEGELAGRTLTTVYAQLRSSCAQSPVYSASITYDATGPELARVRLGDVEAESGVGTELVVVETEATVPLAIDGVDTTGLRATVTLAPVVPPGEDPGDAEIPPPQVFEAQADGLIALREQVSIPLEEGRYLVEVAIEDLAGNAAGELPTAFGLIRDTEPPTTPIPAAADLETFGGQAYVWLQERDCVVGDDPLGNEITEPGFICEENPRAFSFFEVRGGPALLDFTGFDQPPFSVPVFEDGETEIEIRAVDEAGNASPSLGRVTVIDRSTRVLAELTPDRRLGPAVNPHLAGAGGTVLFLHEPRSEQAADQDTYLISQPVALPAVGTRPETSVFPGGIRRLTYDPDLPFGLDLHEPPRRVGGLAGGGGVLTWVEALPELFVRRARLNLVAPSADGRFHVADLTETFTGEDGQGLPAPDWDHGDGSFSDTTYDNETCVTRGAVHCQPSGAWAQRWQRPGFEALTNGAQVVITGVAGPRWSLEGEVVETVSFTGPRLIGLRLQSEDYRRVLGAHLEVSAEAGDAAWVASMQTTNDGFLAWRGAPPSQVEPIVTRFSGQGFEEAELGAGTVIDEELIVGFFLPAGVTVDVPLVELDGGGADAGVAPGEGAIEALGLVDLALSESAFFDEQDLADIDAATDPTRAPRAWLALEDDDLLRAGRVSGLSITDLGPDGRIWAAPARSAAAESIPVGDADQHAHYPLAEQVLTETASVVDGPTSLEIPQETGCNVLVDVHEPVALRDLRVHGGGLLDDAALYAYRREEGAAADVFARADLFPLSAAGPHRVFFRPLGGEADSCQDLVQSTAEHVATGTVSSAVVPGTAQTLTGTSDGRERYEGSVLQGEFDDQLLDENMVSFNPVPVNEGEPYWVETLMAPGDDVDMYVKLGAPPTTGDWDCRPFAGSSFEESCFFVIPPGVSELYVAEEGWLAGEHSFSLKVHHPELFGPFPLPETFPENARLELDLTSGGGEDIFPLLGIDYSPDFLNDDCFLPAEPFSRCSEPLEPGDTEFTVGVTQYEAADWTLEIRVFDPDQYEQVQQLPVTPGQQVTVTKSAGRAGLYVGFEPDTTAANAACDDQYSSFSPDDPLECEVVVPTGVDTLYVMLRPGRVDEAYTVTTEIADAGCDVVEAEPEGSESTASAILEPGSYLFWLTGVGSNWPVASPSVEMGPVAAGSVGAWEIVGSANEVIEGEVGDVVFPSAVSLTGQTCHLELVIGRTPRVVAPSVGEGWSVAGVEHPGSAEDQTGVVLAPTTPSPDAGAIALSPRLPAGDVLQATSIVDGRVRWLATHAEGGLGRVEEIRLLDLPDPEAPRCEVFSLEGVGGALTVKSARFEGDRLAVAGVALGQNEVRVYELRADDEGCSTAALVSQRQVSELPQELALSGPDLYLWGEPPQSGGRLTHVDGRRGTPLHPGGDFHVAGFDVGDERAVFSLVARAGEPRSTLVEVSFSPEGPSFVSYDDESPVRGPVAVVGEEGIATLSYAAGEHDSPPRLRVRVGGSVGVVADADPLLAGLGALNPGDRTALGRAPRLAGSVDGALLVAGVDEAGEDVAAIVQASGAGGTLAFGPVGLPATPLALHMGEGVALVVLPEATVIALARVAGSWSVVEPPDVSEGRWVAVAGDRFVEIQNPGFAGLGRQPMYADVVLRDPAGSEGATDAGSDGPERVALLPGGTYEHDFSTGGLRGGRPWLYDLDADPAALWVADVSSGKMAPVEGPHRPLTRGTESIGVAASPKRSAAGTFFVRGLTSGNALYWFEGM